MTTPTPPPPAIVEGFLPVLFDPVTGGTRVHVPTVHTVRYEGDTTLAEAMTAQNEQMVATASVAARATMDVADVVRWLTEHYGYIPAQTNSEASFLTPMFAELPKVPTELSGVSTELPSADPAEEVPV